MHLYPFYIRYPNMNTQQHISGLSRALLVVAALCLAANIFLPIWKIELYAPQYPEGLVLKIFADGLGGNVEIINGLNHYIGMAELHSENFIEFSILRYLFGFFAAMIFLVAVAGRKRGVYVVFVAFVIFSITAMIDFYRWNYNYGHNLDPNAAIIVPGMAYQPPLIGYKQLLNFGAYSIPDTGGILFILSGLLILVVVLMERGVFAKWLKRGTSAPAAMLVVMIMAVLSACGIPDARPVKLHSDMCAYCRMSITDPQFAAQLVTQKGRHYIFDDILCLTGYKREHQTTDQDHYYVADYCQANTFVRLEEAYLLHSDSLRSPMAGNIAGFAVEDSMQTYMKRYSAARLSWEELIR